MATTGRSRRCTDPRSRAWRTDRATATLRPVTGRAEEGAAPRAPIASDAAPGSPDVVLLGRFVAAFKRGIEGEVAAMRTSSGAFELALARGEDLGAQRHAFDLPEAS